MPTDKHCDRRRDPSDVLPLLREQVCRGSLVLFLGAGMAHDAGLPTWAELAAPLRKRLGLGQAVDPLDVADYFVESEEGGRAHPAYALMPGEETTPLLRGWARRGMEPLLFPRLEDIPAFIKELAPDEQPAPPEPLKPHLHGLRKALLAMIGDARKGARPAVDVDEEVRATLRRTEAQGTARRGQAISARELLDLAIAADRLTALDPGIWVALGDVLFHQEDKSGAARAYYRALRQLANGAKLDEDEARRVRGNLARALAGLDRYSPAEWLLRRCIFRPGREERDGGTAGDDVAAGLDRVRLARRPADAFELCYSVTRRIESSRAENRGDESLAAVMEVRDLLEALLDPPLPFARDGRLQRALRHQDAGLTDQIPSPGDLTEPQVFFLNYLGKSDRLGCTLSLDLQNESATISTYLRRANACLRRASAARPLLPYPYAHRLHLAHEPRLPAEDREGIIRQVTAELANLDLNDPDAGALIQRLRQEFPRLPDPGEAPAREPTAPAG